MDGNSAAAQDTPKPKAKSTKKGEYAATAKNLPVAKSLTNGQKVASAALTRLIDQEINKRLQSEGVTSAGQCDDAEFIRRVYLDLVGVIPTASRVTAFMSSKETDKRAKLIDELLAEKRFGSNIAETWVNLMVPKESNNRALKPKPLENWLADHFNKNTPLNTTVYELLTVTGEVDKNPGGTYFVANPTVDKITDNVARMFLGVQLQCAQCHNHPFTDWKQTEYWAMAAFFMKTRATGRRKPPPRRGLLLSSRKPARGARRRICPSPRRSCRPSSCKASSRRSPRRSFVPRWRNG